MILALQGVVSHPHSPGVGGIDLFRESDKVTHGCLLHRALPFHGAHTQVLTTSALWKLPDTPTVTGVLLEEPSGAGDNV